MSPPIAWCTDTVDAVIATDPVLILFAKTPEPGAVKTRLCPPLTGQQAAQLAELLIEHTVRLAQCWPGPVQLAVWPDTRHPLFQRLAGEYGLPCVRQDPGDLGAKMAAAIATPVCQDRPAAIMGCDVPHCPARVLEAAAQHLQTGRNVLGPTNDGGYYFIGLNANYPALFNDIAWGTDQVLNQTRARAAELGVAFTLLPSVTDLDTWPRVCAISAKIPQLARLVDRFSAPN